MSGLMAHIEETEVRVESLKWNGRVKNGRAMGAYKQPASSKTLLKD